MSETFQIAMKRKSVRAYEQTVIDAETKSKIIDAILRSPTAGNQMFYSVIEINDQRLKETLAETCDHQPFIAKAPWVLMFVADCQRWVDYFNFCDVERLCQSNKKSVQKPEEADLLLSCCDALIAAQTAVMVAESMGIGSCYIGDIMERYEAHRELLSLPQYVFPITMVCFGYPTAGQKNRKQPHRLNRDYLVFENKYKRLEDADFEKMYEGAFRGENLNNAVSYGTDVYIKRFSSEFMAEMRRSVKVMLENWN